MWEQSCRRLCPENLGFRGFSQERQRYPCFCVDGISADRDLSPRYQIQISRGIYAESISQCHLYGGTAVRNSCIFKYGELLPVYEQPNAVREHKRDYILFAIYLLLATMTKPSFTIVLVGAAGILMLWRMFRSRFRNFVPTVWLGVCFIPTFMDLLYQFRGVFVPQEGQEGGIGFTFGHVWAQYCGNLPLAIGLAIGFPILVLLLNYKELHKDSIYRFSWQVYVMSFLMAFFLYEKGSGRWISISPGATCTESSSHLWEHCWYCSARQRMPTPGREGLS